jgi:chemotaxis protein CheD
MRAPDDILEVFLQPGEFYFGEGKTRIRTLLGSCVAITLWHPRLHLGGMSHYVLPNRRHRKKHEPLDGRYADEVMEMFMRELRHSHTKPGEYEVKIFGGGRMFQHEGKDGKAGSHLNIPERNVQIGRELVTRYGFRFTAEDLGGNGHRNVMLDLWSGDVWVKKAFNVPALPTE